MNEMGHTCALGAAYMAKFGKEPSASLTQCCRDLGIDCYNEVTEGIFYKNDVLMKSREEIADWLESQGL